MHNLLSSLEPRDAKTGLVRVIVDTPRGSRNKLKYDEELCCFKLSRILPAGHVFPYDFGSIPGTRASDGDGLDVLVLLDEPTFPGCLAMVRLIGGLGAQQSDGSNKLRNDRLIGAPETPANEAEFRHIEELGDHWAEQIEHFFISYNEAQGRTFEPTGWLGPDEAETCLDAAIAAFRKEMGS